MPNRANLATLATPKGDRVCLGYRTMVSIHRPDVLFDLGTDALMTLVVCALSILCCPSVSYTMRYLLYKCWDMR
jgi:hypothetical protein